MKSIFIAPLFLFLWACSSPSAESNNSTLNTDRPTPTGVDALTADSLVQNGEPEPEMNCVFDSSTYKFTTEALKKFDPKVNYRWDDSTKEAVIALNTDSLKLHIGGCLHFSYSAIYFTDSSRYNDEEYIAEKAKWLAQNFFSGGFDKKYVECISKKMYSKEDGVEPFTKLYSIQNPDTTEIMQVYEGWLVQKIGANTIISLSGYIN